MQQQIHAHNIPIELQQLCRWVVWRYEIVAAKPLAVRPEKPVEDYSKGELTKPPYNARTGKYAKCSDSSTWSTFNQALTAAQTGWYDGIGFVTTADDPFTFVDLDITNDASKRDYQIELANKFDTYSEVSPGGGLHIICRGAIPNAIKRDWIEMYSTDRYLTVTGRRYRNSPIKSCDSLLHYLHEKLTTQREILNGHAQGHAIGEKPQVHSDQEILQQCHNAANGAKFKSLFSGQFALWGMPSASECDQAIVNMLVFFTQNKSQVLRLFEMSVTGQRDKYRKRRDKAKYFNSMFVKAHDKEISLIDFDRMARDVDAAVAGNQAVQVNRNAIYVAPDKSIQPDAPTPTNVNQGSVAVPPGLVGRIATYIYNKSYRPIPEAAVCAALSLMAGICGRSYNTYTGLGLNLYILLLAKTAVGKEGARQGIDSLLNHVEANGAPSARLHRSLDGFASGQAILKSLGQNNVSCLSIFNEFGKLWARLNRDRANSNDQAFVELLLTLYSMSGRDDVFTGKAYSDAKNSVPELKSPAFSFYAISTPSTFLDACNQDAIESGFLPRLTIVQYKGGRPRANDFAVSCRVPGDVSNDLVNLINSVESFNRENQTYLVPIDQEAAKIAKAYDHRNDDLINRSEDGYIRQLHSRLHATALKIATLLAVGNHPYKPIVTPVELNYAIKFLENGVQSVAPEIAETVTSNLGEAQLNAICKAAFDFVNASSNKMQSYGVSDAMYNSRIIPLRYFTQKLRRHKCFQRDYLKTPDAIAKTVQTAVDNGDLIPYDKNRAQTQFNHGGKMFMCAPHVASRGG